MNSWVPISDRAYVALEDGEVRGVEANLNQRLCLRTTAKQRDISQTYDGRVQSDVRLGQGIADKVVLALKYLLEAIKRGE